MLRIEQLCKTYANGTEALRGVSLLIDAGEFVVVLGKSGSGKSTLLRCINYLVEPISGRVFLNDEEVAGASSRHLRQLRKKSVWFFSNIILFRVVLCKPMFWLGV
jgi:ABC-type phosphate/phosphonate transport system ATPase subunit